jgi:hypothetical protein
MGKIFRRLFNSCVNNNNFTPVTNDSKFNMKDSAYYPVGVYEDPNAPYNQYENSEIELEVTVSLTISKTVKIWVNDYETEVENDPDDNTPHTYYDFSNCNLEEYVQEQIELPYELAKDLKEKKYLTDKQKELMLKDCSGWIVDDICCELNDYYI